MIHPIRWPIYQTSTGMNHRHLELVQSRRSEVLLYLRDVKNFCTESIDSFAEFLEGTKEISPRCSCRCCALELYSRLICDRP